MSLAIDYSQMGTYTLQEAHKRSNVYVHPRNLPRRVEEDIETGAFQEIKNLSKWVFKIIVLPAILFERLSKIVMTYLVCPFQFFDSKENFYKDKQERIRDFTDNSVEFKSFVLEPEGVDGPKLDAIEIIPNAQKDIPTEEQKWIFFALPNGIIHQQRGLYLFLSTLSRITGVCIACTNYRGARKEPFHRPEKFDELVDDVDQLVQYKTDQGVRPNNCIMHGFSLGGNVAIHVAARHQQSGHEMHYLGENTFNRLHKAAHGYASGNAMVRFAERHVADYLRPDSKGTPTMKGRAYFAVKEIVAFLPHITMRIFFYITMFFEHMAYAELDGACKCIAEIGRTMLFDPLVLASSILALVFSPFADFTHAIRYFNEQLCDDFANHLIFLIARSRTFTTLSEQFILMEGWGTYGDKRWQEIKGEKFATAVKTDTVIEWEASLVNGILNRFGEDSEDAKHTYVHKDKKAGHTTLLLEDNPGLYFRFLERALKIKFPDAVHQITRDQIFALKESFSEME